MVAASHRRDVLAGLAFGAGGLLAAQAQAADLQPSRRPGVGGNDPGPRNPALAQANPDMLNPPATDHGTLPNLKFSFAEAHVRQESGGWTRQVTERELGVSKSIAGVDMRLNAGGIRELHWHKEAEWAYMLYGNARITAIDAQGRNFVEDVAEGDLWYFPSGLPHSIQGLGPDGCEFLLAFDSGGFDEDSTFLISDWFKHVPPEVLGKNFGVDGKLFANTPDPSQLYIFKADAPGPLGPDKLMGAAPVPNSFKHRMTAQDPIRTRGGTVRITDSSNFPAAKTIAAALVEVEPGGMRELRVRLLRPGAHVRFRRRGCRLRAVRDGPLHREYRKYETALPGTVQEQLLRRRLARSMDGADPAQAAGSASASRSAGDGGAAQAEGAGGRLIRRRGARGPSGGARSALARRAWMRPARR